MLFLIDMSLFWRSLDFDLFSGRQRSLDRSIVAPALLIEHGNKGSLNSGSKKIKEKLKKN
jgi:hypothetical protein